MYQQAEYATLPRGTASTLLRILREIDDEFDLARDKGRRWGFQWRNAGKSSLEKLISAVDICDGHCSLDWLLYRVLEDAMTSGLRGRWADLYHALDRPEHRGTRPAFQIHQWNSHFQNVDVSLPHALMGFAQRLIERDTAAGPAVPEPPKQNPGILVHNAPSKVKEDVVIAPLYQLNFVFPKFDFSKDPKAVETTLNVNFRHQAYKNGLKDALPESLPPWCVRVRDDCEAFHLSDQLSVSLYMGNGVCLSWEKSPEGKLVRVMIPVGLHSAKVAQKCWNNGTARLLMTSMWRAYVLVWHWAMQMDKVGQPLDLLKFLQKEIAGEVKDTESSIAEDLDILRAKLLKYKI